MAKSGKKWQKVAKSGKKWQNFENQIFSRQKVTQFWLVTKTLYRLILYRLIFIPTYFYADLFLYRLIFIPTFYTDFFIPTFSYRLFHTDFFIFHTDLFLYRLIFIPTFLYRLFYTDFFIPTFLPISYTDFLSI